MTCDCKTEYGDIIPCERLRSLWSNYDARIRTAKYELPLKSKMDIARTKRAITTHLIDYADRSKQERATREQEEQADLDWWEEA